VWGLVGARFFWGPQERAKLGGERASGDVKNVLGHFRSYRAWEMYKFKDKFAKCTVRITNSLCTVMISPGRP
jgi:hypothetical protein